ncbi:hypothetical protein CORC01_07057 [Colletotrichum orchidophilum]|uniref:Uncharacterized protein n=1 Tax=Colletotrichum orchidophilum TaxID=1209926 RepID=A0A1G4B8P5_9PEZI|nr:uncharacterized protein CORC01_07057 [Colletotrichum orchidophilum]OHE97642.1 hypothetical protein CORC01_07057 [Colletotrichum orchidophilum]
MEEAYKQYANQARRKNRSSTNLNHLSLAPFTSRLPLQDDDALPEHLTSPHHTSYLEGKSAPTTPGLLTRSPARSNSHARRASLPHAHLPKSKSATHLTPSAADRKSHNRQVVSGTTSPTVRRRKDDLSVRDRNDSDWLLRTGALISNENRESKGQAWLVSRQSSTSLTGMRDAEEEAFERELARERELTSRRSSRRGSLADPDGAYTHSARPSRPGSRSASRVGTRSQMLTPMERHSLDEGYFPRHHDGEDYIPGPDFVNLDEQLESFDFDTTQDDEAAVRKLVKDERAGGASWVGNILGWPLFAVEENEEESDDEDVDGEFEGEADEDGAHGLHRSWSARHFEGVISAPEERIPPPKANEGGWQDAAWLLSVATKVLL